MREERLRYDKCPPCDKCETQTEYIEEIHNFRCPKCGFETNRFFVKIKGYVLPEYPDDPKAVHYYTYEDFYDTRDRDNELCMACGWSTYPECKKFCPNFKDE